MARGLQCLAAGQCRGVDRLGKPRLHQIAARGIDREAGNADEDDGRKSEVNRNRAALAAQEPAIRAPHLVQGCQAGLSSDTT